MRILFLLPFLVFTFSSVKSQDAAFGMGYIFGMPGTDMRHTIEASHGINFSLLLPTGMKGLEYGFELGFGSYGSQTNDQLYLFENGDAMLAPVSVNNNMMNTGLLLRYNIMPEASISPFIAGRVGMIRMGTRLSIEDPRSTHTDECPLPLLTETLQRDLSFTQGLGVGVNVDLGGVFKGMGKGRFFVVLSADYLRGSALEYMSVNAPVAVLRDGETAQSVMFPFASQAQPEVEHQYHTGYLYRTRLEFTQFGISVLSRF